MSDWCEDVRKWNRHLHVWRSPRPDQPDFAEFSGTGGQTAQGSRGGVEPQDRADDGGAAPAFHVRFTREAGHQHDLPDFAALEGKRQLQGRVSFLPIRTHQTQVFPHHHQQHGLQSCCSNQHLNVLRFPAPTWGCQSGWAWTASPDRLLWTGSLSWRALPVWMAVSNWRRDGTSGSCWTHLRTLWTYFL